MRLILEAEILFVAFDLTPAGMPSPAGSGNRTTPAAS